MKIKWWVAVLVFLLGIGVGGGIAQLCADKTIEAPDPTTPAATSPTQPATNAPTTPAVEQVGEKNEITGFPVALQYTTLVAEKLIAYDGPYLEDGMEENVVDMAALVLSNTGTTGITYTQIVVVQGGRELFFDATYVPPKSTVLLLEENKQPYSLEPITQCWCKTVIPGAFDWSQRTVRIEEEGMCTLKVTNLTEQKMNCVRVFYKHHEGEKDLYVGGITYSAVIPDLQPGETRTITPYRYASGYTKVVAVIPE